MSAHPVDLAKIDVCWLDDYGHLNPHLPAKPEDGQHVGDSGRCNACGAYRGSPEWQEPCEGRWAESGKMRVAARTAWLGELLREGGPARRIVSYNSQQLAGVHDGPVRFTSEPRYFIVLECGHEREIGYPIFESMRWDTIDPIAACVDKTCPMTRLVEHRFLNAGRRS